MRSLRLTGLNLRAVDDIPSQSTSATREQKRARYREHVIFISELSRDPSRQGYSCGICISQGVQCLAKITLTGVIFQSNQHGSWSFCDSNTAYSPIDPSRRLNCSSEFDCWTSLESSEAELTRLEYLHQVVVDNVPTDPRQPSYAKGKKDRIDGREVIKIYLSTGETPNRYDHYQFQL